MQQIIKAAFFEQYLIPAGQLVELVMTRVDRQVRVDLKHGLFEPLNLASAYALHPNNDDLTKLIPAVSSLIAQLVAVFEQTEAAPQLVASIFQPRSRGLVEVGPSRGRFGVGVDALRERLPAISAAILATMDYSAKTQVQWHREHVDRANPLMVSGQIGQWRKFVRHGSWSRTLHMLGVSDQLQSVLSKSNPFMHDVGVAHTDELWAKVFAYVDATPKKPKVVRIPEGILVSSTADGLLAVIANLDLETLLSKEEREVLAAASDGARSPELVDAMTGNQFLCQTDVTQLAQAIAQVEAERTKRAQEIRKVFHAWRQEADKIRRLRARLAQHFTPDELKLLAVRGVVEVVTA